MDIDRVKKLVIIAMFSDDDLMDLLVLKGGNALDIVHNVAFRSSMDVDFSIENEFLRKDFDIIHNKVEKALKDTFRSEEFEAFDVKLIERPAKVSKDMSKFWGGYQVNFKIIETEKYFRFREDLDTTRRNATIVGANSKRTFQIDISKFEYCEPKIERDLEGYTIYVYTPEMIVLEKIRAICQQMPEYDQYVKNPSRSARARDFFDIYTVFERFAIDLKTKENFNLLKSIFEAKKVPLELIGLIRKYREYHRPDFQAVIDTVKRGYRLESFDYYFDYVVKKTQELKTFWEV